MNARPWVLSETTWGTVKEDPYEVAVLPWGATEAHNYHLPYGTDCYESTAVAEESARKAWDRGARVVVLPTATGREVVLNGVTILEMADGRIRRAADYVDALPMMLQVGGEIRLPGGAVVRQDAPPPIDDEAMGPGGDR